MVRSINVTVLLYHQTLIQVTNLNVIRVYGEPHYRTDIGCGAKETPTSTLIIKTT